MRITMKGGVWKNSEDEILKAAVMKYGLNNWSRVASLLVRKSTKQCKSRWYEWLDPAVKKTEWTRDEEEKLFHLAKLFPNQWRTIAPIVGRTAHQCLEHYDRLLDQAQGRTEEDRLNDPRRLRPGEIDPHPETKPSRADAVDMDDDEKEMLAEARARLANTRGKKAKRKAREKQLEEARRLAALQKRRELKAAGISVGRWKRRNQSIDYAREVPFEKKPAKGFYHVGEDENPKVISGVANFNLQQLEGTRRADEERRLRKEDSRKLKRVMEDNFPEMIKTIQRMNDPIPFRKRTKLSLQAPQLSENELEEILSMGKDNTLEISKSDMSHSAMLIQNSKTVQPLTQFTPMRTPAVENTIRLEAQNAIARITASTPLEGGETPALYNVTTGVGATPHHTVPHTPHPLASTLRQKRLGIDTQLSELNKSGGQDVSVAATPFSQVGDTPTQWDQSSHGGDLTSENSVAEQKMLREMVKNSLSTLPAPQNDVEIALPEETPVDSEKDTVERAIEEDADDVQRREEKEREQERLRLWKAGSQAVQQNLPRPLTVDHMVIDSSGDWEYPLDELFTRDHLQQARDLIGEEMKALVEHDAVTHPVRVKGVKYPTTTATFEAIPLDLLETADQLVKGETRDIQSSTGEVFDYTTSAELAAAWNVLESVEYLYSPSLAMCVDQETLSHEEKLNCLSASYEKLKFHLASESAKARKTESALHTLTKGYLTKNKSLQKSLESLWSEAQILEVDLEAFEKLEEKERKGLALRIQDHSLRLEKQKNFYQELQCTYASFTAKSKQLAKKESSHHLTDTHGPAVVDSLTVCRVESS